MRLPAMLFVSAMLAVPAGAATPVPDKSAIPPSNDISPMEKHPECMERSNAAASKNCEIQDEGQPRHKYPPPPKPKDKKVVPPPNTLVK
jgi:hypothetical protein